jgi:hypothetical protein
LDNAVVIGAGLTELGMVVGYRLDDREIRVRFPVSATDFSLLYIIQIGFSAHSASYSMGSKGYFLGGDMARA